MSPTLNGSTALQHFEHRNTVEIRNGLMFNFYPGPKVAVYIARMGPTLNGSAVLQRFEHGNAVKIGNGIMFGFYPGLPHVYTTTYGMESLHLDIVDLVP